MQIREAGPTDLAFLAEMLFEAFFWDAAEPRPAFAEFRKHPEFTKLLAGWGRPGDRALIAEQGGTMLGAAWFRLWTPQLHSYGFVDAGTPELGLAVVPDFRARGVGRALLQALIQAARADGYAALSLSVDPANRARHLYESEGFRKVGESGTSWTLLLAVGPHASG
jgi:ribosomal protein S18 acetylase RimI-like enzyme